MDSVWLSNAEYQIEECCDTIKNQFYSNFSLFSTFRYTVKAYKHQQKLSKKNKIK